MKKCPAVFLDRDGVLNIEKSYICSVDQLEIYNYAKECVDIIHDKGYLAFVVSNQSGIARGLFSESVLKKINELIINKTGVDKVYYCPHHLRGKVKKFAIICTCRKPQIGLIKKAEKEYFIDLKHSYMVGDRASDILTGQNAGIRTVLLRTGYGEKKLEFDIIPDAIYNDLREFVKELPSVKGEKSK